MPTFSISAIPNPNISALAVVRRTTFDLLTDYTDGTIQDYYGKIIYNLFDNHRFTIIAIGAADKYERNDNISTRSSYNMEAIKWGFLINNSMLLKTMVSRYGIDDYFKNDEEYDDQTIDGLSVEIDPVQLRLFQMLNFTKKRFFIKAG